MIKISFCLKYLCLNFSKLILFIVPLAYTAYGIYFLIKNPLNDHCSLTWKYNFGSIIATNLERIIFYILYKKKIRNKKILIISLLIETGFLSWGTYEIFFGECNFRNIKLMHLSFLSFLVQFIFFLFYSTIIITNIRQRTTGFSEDPHKLLDEIFLLEKRRMSEELGPTI